MVTTIKSNRIADYIAMVVIILMAVGTVFVFSASANVGRQFNLQRFYDFACLRKILFFPLAVLVMYTVSHFNYRRFSLADGWLKSPTGYLLVLSILLLILVLFPQFGTEINRARRWLRIGLGPVTISFQPSELAKYSMVFFLAAFCDKNVGCDTSHHGSPITRASQRSAASQSSIGEIHRTLPYRRRFVPACVVTAVVVALVVTEDFGTAAFISLLALLILVIAGVKYRHILTLLPFGVVAFCAVLFRSPDRLRRIIAFLNPGKWADSANYQANQSLIALGSGGLFGKGLGRGICKYGHLPEDTTDFIFAIIGEELGLVGTAAVIGLFIAFVWLAICVVLRCKDNFGRLLAAGIVLTIAVQAAINIGVVTVVLPTKGIPLPFVSAGGTSMLASAAAVGVLLNIAKQSAEETLGEKR